MSDLPRLALSIRQPWAWSILHAGKRIENRSRRFHYRGPICLHAAKGMTQAELNDFTVLMIAPAKDNPFSGIHVPSLHSLQRGGIIGTAEIVDCVEHSDSPWFFGPFGLVLENVRAVDLIPVNGALGLFDWRKRLEAAHGCV